MLLKGMLNMRTTLRSFSLGLLTTAIVLGIIYTQSSGSTEKTDLTIEDASTFLENEGFHVVTKTEWTDLNEQLNSNQQEENNTQQQEKQTESNGEKQATEDQEQTEEKPEQQQTEEKQQEEKKEAQPVEIEIVSGMTTYDVADLLIDEKVIKDKMEFITYLEDNDYAKYIQIGTFQLKSGMSLYEIAEVLTN